MSEAPQSLFDQALETALRACPERLIRPLAGASLIVTGATGFFGGWVLRALRLLNRNDFRLQVLCLSRNPAAFLLGNPSLADVEGLRWQRADAAGFARIPVPASVTHILHMAASSDARQYAASPLQSARTILDGTLGCIELAQKTGAHLHFVSSGAVYGARRRSDGPSAEDQIVRYAPDPADSAQSYGNAKRMAESMLASGLESYSISRPFAFLGPLLPLDQHFAAGNFLRDAADGRPIVIKGDGSPIRSYMHPADLAIWLLALTARAAPRQAINIGSDVGISIADLAERIRTQAGSPPAQVLGGPAPQDPPAYWPEIREAATLGLQISSPLDHSIQHGLDWARICSRRG